MTEVRDIRKNAFDKLNYWLQTCYKATAAEDEEILCRFGKRFNKFWRIHGDPPLLLLLTKEFPYEPPRLALLSAEMRLKWPHVENDGLICVYPPNTNVRSDSPIEVTSDLLCSAEKLIKRISTSDVHPEFRTEFSSYWRISAENQETYRSIVESGGPTRKVVIWKPKNYPESRRIFGDTRQAIHSWLSKSSSESHSEEAKYDEALLIWLDSPLLPENYPSNAHEVYGLLSKECRNDSSLIDLFICDTDLDVLIGASTEYGNCYGAVGIDFPDYSKAQNGFRKNKIPRTRLMQLATSRKRKVVKSLVDRVDSSWVNGRDHNYESRMLAKTKVVVIGCGALGASVAVLLAQAGVGNMHFIDGETLERPNTARHPLGAEKVGQNKAKALADHLGVRFPHMKMLTNTPDNVCASNIGEIDKMAEADLIISATGVWSSMSLIADAASNWTTPLQTIWQEPRALATHSVLTNAHSSSLRNGFSPCGKPFLEVTSQETIDEWHHVPACGGVFTPYGASDLAFTSGFCATESLKILNATPSRSLHGIWVVSEERLKSERAGYTDDFRKKFNPSPQGGAYFCAWPDI